MSSQDPFQHFTDKIIVKDLTVQGIIGCNDDERIKLQTIVCNMVIYYDVAPAAAKDSLRRTINYGTVCKAVSKLMKESHFYTVEALANAVAKLVCVDLAVPKVTVRIDKPEAIKAAASAGVEITRNRLDYLYDAEKSLAAASAAAEPERGAEGGGKHVVYLALGSNLGDRARYISDALRLVRARGVHVIDTSFLYETPAQYVTDQPPFLNCVVKVATDLDPLAILRVVQGVEDELGRVRTIRWGPRVIDLDVLFYDDLIMVTPELEVPHPRIAERDFVLVPLRDIGRRFIHPVLKLSVESLVERLPAIHVSKVMPIGTSIWRWGSKTFVMGILNVTPDSFSDGGKYAALDAAVAQAMLMAEQGADVIDIGGQSTRPQAEPITAAEEEARVVPVISALRSRGLSVPISIDTYHASVAEAALRAGAAIVNDVTGANDPAMLPLVARECVPIVMMHMRGDSKTMSRLTDYSADGGVVKGVANALRMRCDAALSASIPRWQIVLDPGLGFAKTPEQSMELIRHLDSLVSLGYPVLVGPSRKGFIGRALGETSAASSRRVWGTAAACCLSATRGADIVRIHDTAEVGDALKVTDAILRPPTA